MSKYNLQDTDYQLFFPENLKKYKNLKSLSLELEKQLKKEIILEVQKLAIFKNLELQSDEILSELAYQYMIDNWQENLNREVKIKLIKNAYWAHSKKGTKKLIESNLEKLGYPIKLHEWFEYDGDPFTFKIVTNSINKPNWIEPVIEVLNKYKNCRSILDTIEVNFNSTPKNLKVGIWKVTEIDYVPNRTNEKINYKKLNVIGYKVNEIEYIPFRYNEFNNKTKKFFIKRFRVLEEEK